MSYEINIGDYGRVLFEMAVGDRKCGRPAHWESIQAEAEPLVRQLIALNQKMGSPYKIHGYTENGKAVKSEHQRLTEAIKATLEIRAGELQVGDLVFLHDLANDLNMSIFDNDPVKVKFINESKIWVEHPHEKNELIGLHQNERVLKSPEDFEELWSIYTDRQYWLEIANKLEL